MAFDLTDYIPHGMVAALAAIATWVFQDHAKRDERRFDKFGDAFLDLDKKLDTAIAKQAENHSEILKILLDQRRV